ncbi:MAG: acyl-CoA thioesterase [Desulfamplus sp.]|nr:acyl-CoA thioesterase [Desulfamplus sp.]
MNKSKNRYSDLTLQASQLLETCSTVIQIPISWADMNAAQHVSNAVYFRYFEDARVDFFEQINFSQRDEETGIGIVLASISCKFKIPLVYPDTLSIGTKISSMQEDRFIMHHLVVSHKYQKLAAQGEALIVTYDYKKGAKIAMPQSLIQKIG